MNLSSISSYFLYASLLSALLPLFTGVTFFNKLNIVTTPFLFFFYYVVLHESFSFILSRYSTNTLWWMNINQLLEFMFFTWFFIKWLGEKNLNTWYFGLVLFFLPYWCYSTFIINNFYASNSFAHAIECLVIVLLAGFVLIKLSKNIAIPLFKNPKFWLASGAMVYFSFSVLVYAIYQVIVNNKYKASLFEPVWLLHSFMNIFSNLLYSIAFLCPARPFKYLKMK